MEIPSEIVARMPGYRFEPAKVGESGAGVWRCMHPGLPDLFLKLALLSTRLRLDEEAERLRWMREHNVRVPAVREYGSHDSFEYLLLDAIPGADAGDARWARHPHAVAIALGSALAQLHRTPIDDCPFDHRIAWQLHDASVRAAEGRVAEDEFDAERIGRPLADLFAELLAKIPADEELVLVHGDYCLPNVILEYAPSGEIAVAAFIDCARAGVADRYQDLALAIRSIAGNLGEAHVTAFLRAYGLDRAREDKVVFFTLLDEFF